MRGQLSEVQRLRQANTRLRNENKRLRERVKVLELENAQSKAAVEDLKLQIEELKRIIFGGGKKGGQNEQDDWRRDGTTSSDPKRDSNSYRRSVPLKEEITDIKRYRLEQCPKCNGCLSKLKKVERYTEDILPIGEWRKVLKQVTKEIIETGYCGKCRRRVVAKRISPQITSLGANVSQFAGFATTILCLSYEQIKSFLGGAINLKVSDGEIARMIGKEASLLSPVFERLKANIRGQPSVHYDETSWKVQKAEQGNHAWVMTGTETVEAIFLLGRSRGKGNIEELRGEKNPEQIGISDDYGAYKNAFRTHALCWAHPYRKLRDLKTSEGLSLEKQNHCKRVYEQFAKLYHDVQNFVAGTCRKTQEKVLKFKENTMKRFERIVQLHPLDPLKMRRIKKRMLEQKNRYFVCVSQKGVPADNNKAERALRPLVLKRKNSYGSKTQAGADRLSILYSVLLSAWWRSKETFFKDYSNQFANT